MRLTWKTELPQWIMILGMLVAAAAMWPSAPERFPVHWDWTGQVDRYGGKLEGMLALPLTTLAIYLLLLFLPRIDPGRANYARFAGAYATLRLAVVAFMTVLYAVSQLAARGYAVDMALVVPMLVGVLLIVIGNLMGKLRPNWFAGIRTPWTLSSKRSWIRTHRLGGWLLIAMGLSLMLAAALQQAWAFLASAAIFVGGVIWMVVYSYLVWRDDPDRIPPAGTQPR